MSNIINVGISDLNVSRAPAVIATYALGSCVGICLHDKIHSVGGLAHIMLPNSREVANGAQNPRKYADTGITELIELMMRNGASMSCLTAKIAGGAQMFETKLNTFNIGERNVLAVKQALNHYKIRILAEDTGLNYGRTVFFDVDTGVMQVKSVTKGIVNL